MLMLIISANLQSQPLSVDFSVASYRLDEDFTLWELYYAFPENSISYELMEDIYIGKINFSIKINSVIKTELTDEWSVSHAVKEKPKNNLTNLYGLRSFKLLPGQYKAELIITDANDETNTKTVDFSIIIRNFQNDRLEMSDILLSGMILSERNAGNYANPLFYRNSLYVYPNPSAEIYGKSPQLKLYAEIYNAADISPSGLQLHYHIYDGAKREVYYYPKSIESVSNGIVEHISIPLDALPTGVYNLVLAEKSLTNHDSVAVSKRFYLINAEMPPALDIKFTESLSFETSEFATLSPERLEREFRQVRMIASKAELEQYKLLTDDKAKARFMYQFWSNRNIDTLAPYNKALLEHRQKIEYENTYYSFGRNDNGWDTDRGHVLLKYGEPTRRDFFSQKGNERAYESWFYGEMEGGVYFYFVDVGSFGNFQLVHSTKSGEFYNIDWYEFYVPISKENRDDYKISDEDRRFYR